MADNKPKKDRDKIREEKLFKRRSKAQRAEAAVNDAAERKVKLLQHELRVAELESIPSADRPGGWQDEYNNATMELAKDQAAITAIEAHAESLIGKPFTSKEKKDKQKAVDKAKVDQVKQYADSWEDTLAAHQRNLAILEAVPEALRSDDDATKMDDEIIAIEAYERMFKVIDNKYPEARSTPSPPVTPSGGAN